MAGGPITLSTLWFDTAVWHMALPTTQALGETWDNQGTGLANTPYSSIFPYFSMTFLIISPIFPRLRELLEPCLLFRRPHAAPHHRGRGQLRGPGASARRRSRGAARPPQRTGSRWSCWTPAEEREREREKKSTFWEDLYGFIADWIRFKDINLM